MLLWSNQRSFFRRFHVILIRLSYSDHVAYISFIFLLPSFLPFAMKFILSLLDEKFPLSEFKCQNSNNNNADDSMRENWEGKMSWDRRKNVKRKVFKRKIFSVTKLLCCHVDCEKLCVPYFYSRDEEEKESFVILDIIYWFIIITENETWSKAPLHLSLWLVLFWSIVSCLACKFILVFLPVFASWSFCYVKQIFVERIFEINYVRKYEVCDFTCQVSIL